MQNFVEAMALRTLRELRSPVDFRPATRNGGLQYFALCLQAGMWFAESLQKTQKRPVRMDQARSARRTRRAGMSRSVLEGQGRPVRCEGCFQAAAEGLAGRAQRLGGSDDDAPPPPPPSPPLTRSSRAEERAGLHKLPARTILPRT